MSTQYNYMLDNLIMMDKKREDLKLHNENGPAVIHDNGTKRYYLNGDCYSFEKWQHALEEVDKQPLERSLRSKTKWVKERAIRLAKERLEQSKQKTDNDPFFDCRYTE